MSTVNLLEELTRELRKKEALEKDFIQLQEENAKLQEENVKLQKEVVKLSQKEDTTLKSQNVCQRGTDTTSPTDEEASFLPYLRDLLIYKNSVDTSKQMLQLVYASLDFMIAGSGMLNQFKTQSELAEYIKKALDPIKERISRGDVLDLDEFNREVGSLLKKC